MLSAGYGDGLVTSLGTKAAALAACAIVTDVYAPQLVALRNAGKVTRRADPQHHAHHQPLADHFAILDDPGFLHVAAELSDVSAFVIAGDVVSLLNHGERDVSHRGARPLAHSLPYAGDALRGSVIRMSFNDCGRRSRGRFGGGFRSRCCPSRRHRDENPNYEPSQEAACHDVTSWQLLTAANRTLRAAVCPVNPFFYLPPLRPVRPYELQYRRDACVGVVDVSLMPPPLDDGDSRARDRIANHYLFRHRRQRTPRRREHECRHLHLLQERGDVDARHHST